jgi:glycine betaine/proline transport system ATP-binding protein
MSVAIGRTGVQPTISVIREKTGSVVAVRDVSFDVARGEVFVVMGPSGARRLLLA